MRSAAVCHIVSHTYMTVLSIFTAKRSLFCLLFFSFNAGLLSHLRRLANEPTDDSEHMKLTVNRTRQRQRRIDNV